MKTKLVLWGTDAQEQRVLLAIELVPEENMVKTWTFREPVATEELSEILMNKWRNGDDIVFPEGYTLDEKELSVTGNLLPEEIKVERTDIINRAQTEWHFIVLSSKMSAMYQSELADLKTRVEKLESFDDEVWEELKTFWDKVQQQVRERNIFRDHADALRDKTNDLFGQMKNLRSQMNEEFRKGSRQVYEKFQDALKEIEDKTEEGSAKLSALFEDLKGLQRQFRNADLTREHRANVWERLDNAFKAVKVKRFGEKAGKDTNPLDRLERRYKGLLSAIDKMQKSIKRDQDDLNFQKKKIDTTDGQLEAQIRQAKILMIEERVRSKEDKLSEMLNTKSNLESRMEDLKKKEAERKEREKIEAAKEAVKEKIAEDIKHAAEDRVSDEKIQKAAEAVAGTAAVHTAVEKITKEEKESAEVEEESLMEAVSETLGESLEDVVDTVKAVASVIGDRIEDAVEDLKKRMDDDEQE